MSTTTTELYSVNGIDLNTLAYNFTSLEGRLGTPSLRGANSEIAFGPDAFRSKWVGPRTEQWAMWIRNVDPADDSVGGRDQFRANLSALKKLLMGNPAVPLALQRIVADPDGLITQTATGECVAITPAPKWGGVFADVVVEIHIPDGLWRGDTGTQDLSGDTGLTVAGDCIVTATSIVTSGDFTMVNTTTGTGITYTGGAATIYPGTLLTDPGSAAGGIVPLTARWFDLVPGDNEITLSGAVTLNWQAGYQ